MSLRLVADRLLQFRVTHFQPEHVEQIDELPLQAPGGADGEVAEFGLLVGGVPTLDDLLETGWCSPSM